MTGVIHLDQLIFHFINSGLENDFFNLIFPYWRAKSTWIPLYIALVVFLIYRFRKTGLYLVLAAMTVVGVADIVSSRLIKESVQRIRPCNDPEIIPEMNVLVPCGSGYSFTSSHATNHFALAVFLVLTLGAHAKYKWVKWPLLLWAFSIAFGQVYVGVHYPIDVVAGALVGTLLGWAGAKAALKYFWKSEV